MRVLPSLMLAGMLALALSGCAGLRTSDFPETAPTNLAADQIAVPYIPVQVPKTALASSVMQHGFTLAEIQQAVANNYAGDDTDLRYKLLTTLQGSWSSTPPDPAAPTGYAGPPVSTVPTFVSKPKLVKSMNKVGIATAISSSTVEVTGILELSFDLNDADARRATLNQWGISTPTSKKLQAKYPSLYDGKPNRFVLRIMYAQVFNVVNQELILAQTQASYTVTNDAYLGAPSKMQQDAEGI